MISKSQFITDHIADMTNDYNILKELGNGAYGKVLRVQSKETGNIFACKKINKKQIRNKKRFKTEIDLLLVTDHPNIVKLYDIYEDTRYIYLIREECLGGEFFDRLEKKAKSLNMYTEKEVVKIFKQILDAVNYLHAHGICHRDIKPENILFSSIEENSPISLIDFGLSKVFNKDDNTMNGVVGTSFYMAPEIITGGYNEKCDVWSCGVILYIMLCGKPPFYSEDEDELKEKICSMNYDFNNPEFAKVSDQAKEFIKKILVHPDYRPRIADMLEEEWIKQNAPHSTNLSLSIDWEHIKKISKLNSMQKCAINFSSLRLTEDKSGKYVDMFKSLDENSDGVLSYEEIEKGVENCDFGFHIDPNDLIDVFNQMDVDNKGVVIYTDFVSALIDYEYTNNKKKLLECFECYDSDESEKIAFEDFCDMIKPQNEEQKNELFNLYKKFDTNNDGEIDFNDLKSGI